MLETLPGLFELMILAYHSSVLTYYDQTDVAQAEEHLLEQNLIELQEDGRFKLTERGHAHIINLIDMYLPEACVTHVSKPYVAWINPNQQKEIGSDER